MEFSFEIHGGDFTKAGFASSEVKKVLKQLNLPNELIKRTAVAMYEAEVNVVAHAHKGTMNVSIDSKKVVICIEDEGPGIEDIDIAMQEGFSTASDQVRQMGFGAGMGLPNIKKNSDIFKINSTVGKGTRLEIVTRIAN